MKSDKKILVALRKRTDLPPKAYDMLHQLDAVTNAVKQYPSNKRLRIEQEFVVARILCNVAQGKKRPAAVKRYETARDRFLALS